MKTVLFLGASPQQLAPIHYARAAGHRVVTSDNRPENPGHRLADRVHEVSTTDAEGILRVATDERVDAVVCYATDVAAPTAAYVAERLGLVGNPRDAVVTLTDKARFRRFQSENGYFAPRHCEFDRNDSDGPRGLTFPLIVKPVDASGGKGIRRVEDPSELSAAIENACDLSLAGRAIAEEWIERQGHQVCGEGFLQDGRVVFHAFANELFHEGLHVPVGETFPSMFDDEQVDTAVGILQDMFDRLGMRVGPFNFDLQFTPGGDVFVIEIGPRNGGNRMPDAIKLAYGADTIAATVEAALGREVSLESARRGFFATYSVHATQGGILQGVDYLGDIRERIVDETMFVTPGDRVERFDMGSNMLGNLILKFETYDDMVDTIQQMDRHVRVRLAPGGAA